MERTEDTYDEYVSGFLSLDYFVFSILLYLLNELLFFVVQNKTKTELKLGVFCFHGIINAFVRYTVKKKHFVPSDHMYKFFLQNTNLAK